MKATEVTSFAEKTANSSNPLHRFNFPRFDCFVGRMPRRVSVRLFIHGNRQGRVCCAHRVHRVPVLIERLTIESVLSADAVGQRCGYLVRKTGLRVYAVD